MRAYLKFAAGFWVRAFLVTGSLGTAHTAPMAGPEKHTISVPQL
jgi:hypothetical protein